MKAVAYNRDRHADGVISIYRSQDWMGMVPRIIPGSSVVVECAGSPIAIACVYLSEDSGVAFVGFIAVRKDMSVVKRGRALSLLMDAAKDVAAKHVGSCGVLLGFTADPCLQHLYQRSGMHIGERTTSSFFLPIGTFNPDFLKEDEN